MNKSFSTNTDPTVTIVLTDSLPKESTLNDLYFYYFPAYAKFLLENYLEKIAEEQLKLSRVLKLPVLKFLESFSDEQLVTIAKDNLKDLLNACSQNKAALYIETSLRKWSANQLPVIARNQIAVEDISLISLIRRRILRHFIPAYTTDPDLFIKIMDEVDQFTARQDLLSFKTLIEIHKELYEQTQELAQIGNWQWDLKTRKLYWSDKLYRIYELEPQSNISAEIVASFNHPDDAAMITKAMQFSQESLQPHDFYYRIIMKDGRQKILHAKGEVILNDNGEPYQMFGTLQDVTLQKQNEKELEDKTSFIQKIADITPCLIASYNVHTGKYSFVNKAVYTLLGYEPKDVLDKGVEFFLDKIHPDDLQLMTEKNNRALQVANLLPQSSAEPIEEFKYRLKHKNGEYRWFHTFGTVFSRDKNNQVEELINISIDITEEYLLSQQLKESEERYHRMVNEVEDYAILMLDKDGFIQNWNKGAEKIKGYKASEIIGKNFRLFYRKEDRENKLPEKLISQAIQTGKASHEGWRVRKDGTHFWGSIVITALHDENNNIIGFSKLTRDLTERKLNEDKLRDYAARIEKNNEELQKINKELDSFTYMASHDLQEPLRKIKIFINLILNRGKEELSAEIREYFDRIIFSAERMQKLIEALLNYSRTNTMEIVYEPINLNMLLEEVKKNLAELIEEKHAIINYKNLPTIQGVPLQLQQLFSNIIENSLKYSKDDVPCVITISSEIDSFKTHTALEEADYYKLSISDNGIGFEQEYAEIIFKLFQRLHGNKEYAGTGIGLAICKKIAENHKGFINAFSEPGKGATFSIYFPVN